MGAATARTATFLFTDIEGSTRLLKRLRDDYGGVLAHHQELLREAFAAHGGQEVDTQGDSFFVVFLRARDAVQAAVAGQHSLSAYAWPDGADVRVRMGIHTGEAEVADNRYVGLSVHRTARICAFGRGGQILISQTTRAVLEDEEDSLPGIELRDLGDQRLKDLDRPVRLTEVVISGLATGAEQAADVVAERAVLPGPLGLTPPFPFVGRSSELAALAALLPEFEARGTRVALVGGEPGSGKTRLVRELAHEAAARGVLVLYGTSDAVVNTPYQPFVESLDFLVRAFEPEEVRKSLGTGGGELTRLLPDLSLRVGPLPAPAAADPDTERHRLHAAVAELLGAASRRRPILVVVDDMHWADAPSLHLFRHLARAGAEARVLLLSTFRDLETDARPEFSDALADLSRIEGVTRVRLGGLSGKDVADFVQRTVGADSGGELPTLAQAIGELTGGNPFLLCELWRALMESGTVEVSEGGVRLTRPVAELGSPESVREVVQYRLARLDPATMELLEVAAVIGPEFELDVLGEAAGLDQKALVSALAEAVRSGMIQEIPGPGLAHRFTHELVRRALYDRLSGVRRAELHLRVGEALELERAGSPVGSLPELAHHFAVAAPVGGTDRAVRYSVRAAEAAMASLAFEEAAVMLSRALELGISDVYERSLIQLELGTAHQRAGQTLDAIRAFTEAAALARSLDEAELLAQAAVGLEEACWPPVITDAGAVELLREAAAALGTDDSALRARVLGSLSRALVFVGEPEQGARIRLESIQMARRLGDPPALAAVLVHAYWARGTLSLEEVLELLAEAKTLGTELGDTTILAEALAWRVVTLVGLCDLDAARAELEALLRVADQTRQPLMLHIAEQFGSAIALCDGRLDEAEAMAERSHDWVRLLRARDPSAVHGVQLFGIRREQGRLADLRPVLQLLATRDHGAPAWRPGLAALLAELDMTSEAESELAELRADGFAAVPRDSLWVGSLAYLTDACAAVGDAESAALLYPEFERLGGGIVQIGQLVACYGAADRYLGMLATILGKWDAAEAHFEYALYLNRRMGARTWAAHTTYEYARMLLRRGGAAERGRAAELLAEAARSAERLGLVALASKIGNLDVEAVPVEIPDGLSPREVEVLRLVARGLSNREIGQGLFISEHTAANHIRSILRKTGCANRTDAASYAHRQGLVDSA